MAFSSTSQTVYSANASIRPNPKPRFLRDPTTIESISSAITGISSYVRKNLPESLKGKQSGFKSSPSNQSSPINSESGFSAIESLRSFSTESKNKVLFADFDYFQDNPNSPKIECLILGYQDGFQIWNMEDYSNITDIITTTTFLGNVKSMKLVPPSPIANSTRTPLLLVGSSLDNVSGDFDTSFETSSTPKINTIKIFCAVTGNVLKVEECDYGEITSILANDYCIVVATTLPSIKLLSRKDFSCLHTFYDVLPNPIDNTPVLTLGSRWLAYSTTAEPAWQADLNDKRETANSTVQVDRMAKGVVNGLKSIGDYGYQQLSNYLNKNEHNDSQLRKNSPEPSFISDLDIPPIFNSNEESQHKKKKNMGRVMIRDTLEFISGVYVYQSTYNETPSPIIAHFQCHYLPLAYLAFDESGSLLVTSSVEGHSFYIFEILGTFSQRQPYKLLYKLNRGITDAQVVNMKFNYDTRWLATTTKHGTTHLFSLNPYGGQPSTDAHLQGRVINKPSSCPLPNTSQINSIRAVSLTSAAKLRQQDSVEPDAEDSTLESILPNVENSRKVFACHFPLKNSQLESWMAKAPQAMEKQSSNDHLPKSDFVFLTFNSDGILTLFKVITSGVVVKSNTYGHIQKRLTLSTKVEGFAEWNLSKYFYKTNLPYESKSLDSEVLVKNSSQNSQPESSWLPHVETQTFNLYTCPSRPLWTLSQFDFMLYSGSLNERSHLSTINFDNLEVKPLKIRKQDLPLPHGKNNISYQQSSSFSEIEDHIMKAMETDLEKPPTPTEHFSQPGNDGLSFEDAYEIPVAERFMFQQKPAPNYASFSLYQTSQDFNHANKNTVENDLAELNLNDTSSSNPDEPQDLFIMEDSFAESGHEDSQFDKLSDDEDDDPFSPVI